MARGGALQVRYSAGRVANAPGRDSCCGRRASTETYLADRPARRASSRTAAAGVVVLLVLAPAVVLAATHRRLVRVGRGVDRQVAVVGVLAGDLLQVAPGVPYGA